PPRRHDGRTHGFTLIELLVVISIVVLLIAILLPALSQARQVARQATCLSQVRQVGLAIAMYAGDHRESFPAWDDPTQNYPDTGFTDPPVGVAWQFNLIRQDYIHTIDFYDCPELVRRKWQETNYYNIQKLYPA